MTPSSGSWSTQQLSEFLVAVAALPGRGFRHLRRHPVGPAEALEAEVAARW